MPRLRALPSRPCPRRGRQHPPAIPAQCQPAQRQPAQRHPGPAPSRPSAIPAAIRRGAHTRKHTHKHARTRKHTALVRAHEQPFPVGAHQRARACVCLCCVPPQQETLSHLDYAAFRGFLNDTKWGLRQALGRAGMALAHTGMALGRAGMALAHTVAWHWAALA